MAENTNDRASVKFDLWERKLLDLSTRNSLLNLRIKGNCVPLFVPGCGDLEDTLVDNKEYRIIPRKSPDKKADKEEEKPAGTTAEEAPAENAETAQAAIEAAAEPAALPETTAPAEEKKEPARKAASGIPAKEAFRLSRELMRGDKRHAFWMDMSLLPGVLLDGATFHLTSLFFFNPYKECLFAELYALVREEKRDGIFRGTLLYDEYLFAPGERTIYPDAECPTPHVSHRSWLSMDYEKDYTLLNSLLFFYLFSLVGWLFEVAFYLVNEGSFINRGVLTGPWVPIYGVGGLLIIYVLKPFRRKPALLFGLSFTMCGALEYFTSWALEQLAGMRWWDYTGYFMNLNGRICLEGLTVFGLAGAAVTYSIAPFSDNLLNTIPEKKRKVLAIFLSVIFLADCIWSVFHPNTGNGITEGFY